MGAGLSNELINLGALISGATLLNTGLKGQGRNGGVHQEQLETYHALLDLVVARIEASESAPRDVLEICSGFGTGGREIRQRLGVAPVGLDISRVAAAVATWRAERRARGSVADMPYADETFDLVVGVECLICLDDPMKGAAESARVLRRGGALAIAEFRLSGIAGARRDAQRMAGAAGLRLVAFEDKTEQARASALDQAELRARSLRFIPPPFRNWAREVATAPGSARHGQWLRRERCYFLAVFEKP